MRGEATSSRDKVCQPRADPTLARATSPWNSRALTDGSFRHGKERALSDEGARTANAVVRYDEQGSSEFCGGRHLVTRETLSLDYEVSNRT